MGLGRRRKRLLPRPARRAPRAQAGAPASNRAPNCLYKRRRQRRLATRPQTGSPRAPRRCVAPFALRRLNRPKSEAAPRGGGDRS
eukprot:6445377-Pyramimonas_sp.AAC.1